MNKLPPIVGALLIIAGCATNEKKLEIARGDDSRLGAIERKQDVEVNKLSAQISRLKQTRRYFTSARSKQVYIEGRCTLPAQNRRKPNECDSNSGVLNYAVKSCGARTCDSVIEFATLIGGSSKNWSNSFASGILQSAACKAVFGENVMGSLSAGSILDNLLSSKCGDGSGGILEKGSCVWAGFSALNNVSRTKDCIEQATQECISELREWNNVPYSRQRKCQQHLQVAGDGPVVISNIDPKISSLEASLKTLNEERVLIREERSVLGKRIREIEKAAATRSAGDVPTRF